MSAQPTAQSKDHEVVDNDSFVDMIVDIGVDNFFNQMDEVEAAVEVAANIPSESDSEIPAADSAPIDFDSLLEKTTEQQSTDDASTLDEKGDSAVESTKVSEDEKLNGVEPKNPLEDDESKNDNLSDSKKSTDNGSATEIPTNATPEELLAQPASKPSAEPINISDTNDSEKEIDSENHHHSKTKSKSSSKRTRGSRRKTISSSSDESLSKYQPMSKRQKRLTPPPNRHHSISNSEESRPSTPLTNSELPENIYTARVHVKRLTKDVNVLLNRFKLSKIRDEHARVIASKETDRPSENESDSDDNNLLTRQSSKKSSYSSEDSDDDKLAKKKVTRKSKRKRILSDSSEASVSSGAKENSQPPKHKRNKRTRLRKPKPNISDDSSDDAGSSLNMRKKNIPKSSAEATNSNNNPNPDGEFEEPKKKQSDSKDLEESEAKKAATREMERKKRIAELQKLYNCIYYNDRVEVEELEKLVLDFDEETREELISVDKGLVKKLKPHQAQGVKFMWDTCFESIDKIQENSGSGCILAHCMGLGKTLQVVTLAHTLLAHSKETSVRKVLIICPVSTVLNWVNEFRIWLRQCKHNRDIDIYEISKYKQIAERSHYIDEWHKGGGVLILGYDMFRNLTGGITNIGSKEKKIFQQSLLDPGADLVVCDEGHLLKNSKTSISKAVNKIRTLRRIVLTGTPLQNNLNEYYCMVQFVKPGLLGNYDEFTEHFANPITNGQYTDSTDHDIKMMKWRSYILNKLMATCIQRKDYSVLAPFLPPKQEYVIYIRMTQLQVKLYKYYMAKRNGNGLMAAYQQLLQIWTHPRTLKCSDVDINDEFECHEDLASDSDVKSVDIDKSSYEQSQPTDWWKSLCPEEELDNMEHSGKLMLLFSILTECEAIGDKLLVFSQSLITLDVIEHFLRMIDENTQNANEEAKLGGFTGSWKRGIDYFRLDGSTSIEKRNSNCNTFNSDDNLRARLFLISTRAGGIGINLVAANRVIIMDASWNPSHDIQSIFRVYRFGQNKPCYIYRFIALGTMEEKIYERQVIKLAISKRVVDEHQIERHYRENDLAELYNIENIDPTGDRSLTAIVPKDRLLANQLEKIWKYHEHDSLLENKAEETLSKEEVIAAWKGFEEQKKLPVNQQTYISNPQTTRGLLHNSQTKMPARSNLQRLGLRTISDLFVDEEGNPYPDYDESDDSNTTIDYDLEQAIAKSGTKVNEPKQAEETTDVGTEEITSKATKKVAAEKKEDAPKVNATTTDYSKIDFNTNRLFIRKICSWNVGGLRDLANKNGIEYFKREDPDIICLQEIKCLEDQVPQELKEMKGYHSYWCSTLGDRGGVAILTKRQPLSVDYNIGDKELDEEGRIITGEYIKFYLICVNVPNAGRDLKMLDLRLRWNKLFEQHVSQLKLKKPVIICGDMNVAHNEIDLKNPKTNMKSAGFTKEEREGMTDLLHLGFIDTYRHLYPNEENAYTFWSFMNNARAKNIGWRLDYALVSKNIVSKVVDCYLRPQVMGSDHCPVNLLLNY